MSWNAPLSRVLSPRGARLGWVSGKIGEKEEIERLIKKLELDKEILAEQEPETEDDEAASVGGLARFYSQIVRRRYSQERVAGLAS
jgi:hypothetical protein